MSKKLKLIIGYIVVAILAYVLGFIIMALSGDLILGAFISFAIFAAYVRTLDEQK